MLFEKYFERRTEHLLNINGASLEFFYYKPSIAERIKSKIMYILFLLSYAISLFLMWRFWNDSGKYEILFGVGLYHFIMCCGVLGGGFINKIRVYYLRTGFKYLKIPLAIAWLQILSIISYLIYIIVLMVLKIVEVHF